MLEQIIQYMPIKGVIHIGAYIGEEFNAYQKAQIKKMIFFEPQYNIYQVLLQNISRDVKDEDIWVFNQAVGNMSGITNMYIASNPKDPLLNIPGSASSSILEPKKHLTDHPEVVFPYRQEIQINTLDNVMIENKFNISDFNFLNVDVQGYELEVFKGATQTLQYIDFILTEINGDELYKNCALVEDLDKFLNKYKFQRKQTEWVCKNWGNAFYRKVQ